MILFTWNEMIQFANSMKKRRKRIRGFRALLVVSMHWAIQCRRVPWILTILPYFRSRGFLLARIRRDRCNEQLCKLFCQLQMAVLRMAVQRDVTWAKENLLKKRGRAKLRGLRKIMARIKLRSLGYRLTVKGFWPCFDYYSIRCW